MNSIPLQQATNAANKHLELICPKLKKAKNNRIYHADSTPGKLFAKLRDNAIPPPIKNILYFLYSNIENIIKGDVSTLLGIINNMERLLAGNQIEPPTNGGKVTNGAMQAILKDCFNYETYAKSDHPYTTLMEMGFESCPYCNRQYILTYQTPGGRTRGTLDHFFNKKEYRYLALSFFNLVPSCYSCNSNLKLDKSFLTSTHINPYIESFDTHAKFTINYKKTNNADKYVSQFYLDKNFLEIDFVDANGAALPGDSKADGNIRDFQLKGLYNLHKDLVVEILQKQAIYNNGGYAKSLVNAFPKLFNNEHDILKFILGNYTQNDRLHKRPFSRLTRDICDEIGLTQQILNDLVS